MHTKYNNRIYAYDKEFQSVDKTKVLVIGNSFARDWANVLMESRDSAILEIFYLEDPDKHTSLESRMQKARVIFYSTPDSDIISQYKKTTEKLWVVGTKNFGTNNGLFYSKKGSIHYYQQRTLLEKGYLKLNQTLAKEWNTRYLDFIVAP